MHSFKEAAILVFKAVGTKEPTIFPPMRKTLLNFKANAPPYHFGSSAPKFVTRTKLFSPP